MKQKKTFCSARDSSFPRSHNFSCVEQHQLAFLKNQTWSTGYTDGVLFLPNFFLIKCFSWVNQCVFLHPAEQRKTCLISDLALVSVSLFEENVSLLWATFDHKYSCSLMHRMRTDNLGESVVFRWIQSIRLISCSINSFLDLIPSLTRVGVVWLWPLHHEWSDKSFLLLQICRNHSTRTILSMKLKNLFNA